MPTVSVIIPAFNNGPFIGEAIRSVLDQATPVSQIIVIDDGSIDDTESVVRSFDDPRVMYRWQPNSGVSTARNHGLEHATGDYIAFLDADDRWRPDMLLRQQRIMESDPSLVCCFANFVRFINATGEQLPDQFTFFPELRTLSTIAGLDGSSRVILGDAFEALVAFSDFPAFMLTMLFRTKLIEGLRFNRSLVRCQDADFVLRAYRRGKVAFSDHVVADVRRHSLNATRNVELMTLDKLKALECVRAEPLSASQLTALDRRIGRARFEAAETLMRERRYREGVVMWRDAVFSHTSLTRKLKSSVRLSLALFGRRSEQ